MFEQICPLCNEKSNVDNEDSQEPVNSSNILHTCTHCGFDNALRIVPRGGDQYEAIVHGKSAKTHRTKFVECPELEQAGDKYMQVGKSCGNKECREGPYRKRLLKMIDNVERGISICKLCGTTAMLQ